MMVRQQSEDRIMHNAMHLIIRICSMDNICYKQQMDVQDQQLPISNKQQPSNNNNTNNIDIGKQDSTLGKLCWAVIGVMIVGIVVAYLYSISYVQFCYYQQDQLELHQLHRDSWNKTNATDSNSGSGSAASEQLLQQILSKPKTNNKYKDTKQAYLAYQLYTNITDSTYKLMEKQYLQSKYHISHYHKQQVPLCVVSAGRNLVFQLRYQAYLESIARQQYANYRVILVDDSSDDATSQAVNQYLTKPNLHPLRDRLTLVKNPQRKYALFSKDTAITHHCSATDIIVEVDPDDQLIGTQVFAAINAIYSANSSIWAMYSSYIYWHPECGCPTEGISGPVSAKVLQEGTYRSTTNYYTSATKTYRRQLYDKIDKKDFVNQNGQYHKWTSDLFVHYSLVELAGIEHYRFVHDIFYFYHRDHNNYNRVQKAMSRLDALSIEPYNKLNSLTDPSTRNAKPRNLQWIERKKQDLLECISQRNEENCDVSI